VRQHRQQGGGLQAQQIGVGESAIPVTAGYFWLEIGRGVVLIGLADHLRQTDHEVTHPGVDGRIRRKQWSLLINSNYNTSFNHKHPSIRVQRRHGTYRQGNGVPTMANRQPA
jgi:hypothetical protein